MDDNQQTAIALGILFVALFCLIGCLYWIYRDPNQETKRTMN